MTYHLSLDAVVLGDLSRTGASLRVLQGGEGTMTRPKTTTPGEVSKREPGQELRAETVPKYRQIYDELRAAIEHGQYKAGDRLPSEAELGVQYSASRITIAKAVRELQTQQLVSRRAGRGTHVLRQIQASGYVFGLLIPDLGRTEIFEPICRGIMQSPQAKSHSLLWGHAIAEEAMQEQEAIALCEHYISKRVDGVFFAPLELTLSMDATNQRIVSALEEAGIAIVLLDRCFARQPMRSRYDLVGIDNRRAGALLTSHLLRLGAQRIAFVARPNSASTVAARMAGYREAIFEHGGVSEDLTGRGDPADPAFLRGLLDELHPDAIVCANDLTAAKLMANLIELGYRIPAEMRVVGFDDVKYASLLPVPLTTQHQNCEDIGAAALRTMLQRLENPSLPTLDVLLQTHTVVRRSCGAQLHGG